MARFNHYEACPRCTDSGRDRSRDNLAVYDDSSAHCFSCGYHRWPRGGSRLPLPNLVVNDKQVLPADFSREVPARAWEWLLQYGLSWKYWQPFVGWSEKDSRLVFTVGEPVHHSIGRFIPVEGRTGTKEPRKWFTYGDCHKTAHVIQPKEDGPERIVLVEDLISAHKVGQVATCIPLFGTKVFSAVIPVLRHYKLPILMWLDKDQDQFAAKRAAGLAVLTGLPVSYVSTNQDPKLLTISKITEIVK